jgi:hypothetical protein
MAFSSASTSARPSGLPISTAAGASPFAFCCCSISAKCFFWTSSLQYFRGSLVRSAISSAICASIVAALTGFGGFLTASNSASVRL